MDIEGTIGSIRFVRDVLFPYAAARLPAFVHEHHGQVEVRQQLDSTAQLTGVDRDDLDTLIGQLIEWTESDTKATPLKALQGMVWKTGFERGDYQAHFYPDAVTQMNAWQRQGMALYVYSSGSIQAQQLYFRYSSFGDLSALISGWFDTTTGAKQDPESYRKICAALALPPSHILFLSDVEAELDAAGQVGIATILVARAEDRSDASTVRSGHRVVASFCDIPGLRTQ